MSEQSTIRRLHDAFVDQLSHLKRASMGDARAMAVLHELQKPEAKRRLRQEDLACVTDADRERYEQIHTEGEVGVLVTPNRTDWLLSEYLAPWSEYTPDDGHPLVKAALREASVVDHDTIRQFAAIHRKILEQLRDKFTEPRFDGLGLLPSEWATYRGLVEEICSATDLDEQWSAARSPSDWAKVFKESVRTLNRRIDADELHVIRVTSKRWKILKTDLPDAN